ncbi:MAG: hypothetical protein Q8N82_05490, partial [Deltaproteobacteria bacterium]|nr:hypothetical protein [Deltaproteobacteria bacterium]
MRHKSLYFNCHSGLDPESSLFTFLGSCPPGSDLDGFRRNDDFCCRIAHLHVGSTCSLCAYPR